MKHVRSGGFAVMAGALVCLGATALLIGRSAALKGGVVADASEDFQGVGPGWGFVHSELDRLITELEKEKEAAIRREQQLKELDAH